MMVGALLAAATDLSFSVRGYAATLANDVCTAAYLVMLKRLPAARELDTLSLLYYNSLISLVPLALAAVATGELRAAAAFDGLGGMGFRVAFAACVCLGLSTSHSTYVCTRANEPLTTTVAGSFKNILMTAIGAFAFGDYAYEPLNAAGIALSMLGAIWYALHSALSKRAASSG
jgi:solute carrier family 35